MRIRARRRFRATPMLALGAALATLALLLVPDAPADAASVGGVTFPDKVSITPDGRELVLNGAGERRILLLRIYAIALYLPARAHTLADAVAMAGPKRMHMVMLRNEITAKQVHDHVVARIGDGSQPAEMALMQKRLAELDRIIEAEHVINLGGSIMLDYVPGVGTIIRVDGAQRGDPIPGDDFYDALLRIWLGDSAKSLTLRDQLLGRS